MNAFIKPLLVLLAILMISVSAFSQQPAPNEQADEASSSSDGMSKMPMHQQAWDVDIQFDEEALATDIESAMASLEIALQDLEIQLEQVEFNLNNLDFVIDPIDIDPFEMEDIGDIEIEGIEDIEMEDVNIDIGENDFRWHEEE